MKKIFTKTKKLLSLFAVMTVLALQFAPVAGAANFTGQNLQTTISGGQDHTAVLLDDGTVEIFGLNSYGQLGDGTTNNSNSQVSRLRQSNNVK